jgi:hypothetical protein
MEMVYTMTRTIARIPIAIIKQMVMAMESVMSVMEMQMAMTLTMTLIYALMFHPQAIQT